MDQQLHLHHATATFGSTGSADQVTNGQWWDTNIYFSDIVQRTLGFSGYLLTTDPERVDAPEPATFLIVGIALAALARRKTIPMLP